MKQALMVVGGWPGHTPEKSADVFTPLLEDAGFNVQRETSLDAYLDADLMDTLDLIVPIWTQGQIAKEQLEALMGAGTPALELPVGTAVWQIRLGLNLHTSSWSEVNGSHTQAE